MSFATQIAFNILIDMRCIVWVISQYFFFFQIKNLVSLHLHEAQRRQHGGDHQDPRRVGRHSLGGPAATAAIRICSKAAYNSYRNVLEA